MGQSPFKGGVPTGAATKEPLALSIDESLLHSLIGGCAGLVLGSWTLRGLVPLFARSLPPSISIDVDARAALFVATARK